MNTVILTKEEFNCIFDFCQALIVIIHKDETQLSWTGIQFGPSIQELVSLRDKHNKNNNCSNLSDLMTNLICVRYSEEYLDVNKDSIQLVIFEKQLESLKKIAYDYSYLVNILLLILLPYKKDYDNDVNTLKGSNYPCFNTHFIRNKIWSTLFIPCNHIHSNYIKFSETAIKISNTYFNK